MIHKPITITIPSWKNLKTITRFFSFPQKSNLYALNLSIKATRHYRYHNLENPCHEIRHYYMQSLQACPKYQNSHIGNERIKCKIQAFMNFAS